MSRFDDYGKLVLRLSVGILMLMHGLHKMMNGISGITAMVQANGWPAWISYGVFVGEIIAPVLIIIGFLTRPSALVLVLNMLVAIFIWCSFNCPARCRSFQRWRTEGSLQLSPPFIE